MSDFSMRHFYGLYGDAGELPALFRGFVRPGLCIPGSGPG